MNTWWQSFLMLCLISARPLHTNSWHNEWMKGTFKSKGNHVISQTPDTSLWTLSNATPYTTRSKFCTIVLNPSSLSRVQFSSFSWFFKPYTSILLSLQEKNKNNTSDDDGGIMNYLHFKALTHSCNAVSSLLTEHLFRGERIDGIAVLA